MKCSNCGQQIPDNVRFCPQCGAPQNIAQSQQFTAQQNAQPSGPYAAQMYTGPGYAGNGVVRLGIPLPGYSDRVNDPEILAAVKKNRKAAGIFGLILVPIPLIGFVIYSLVTKKMETGKAALIGGIVSAVFLIFALVSLVKSRAKHTYDAVVTDKKTRRVERNNSSYNSYYTKYITVAKREDGKKIKLVERDGSQIWAWDYLRVGAQFRYHPQFLFPYELYDKSQAPYIACVGCTTRNPVISDRCQKCGLPLLK